MINPKLYTKISIFPRKEVLAPDAIIRTVDNTGPIHGVHAKLKVNPIINAINGFIFLESNPILCSLSIKLFFNSPKSRMRIPLILVNKTLLLLKKPPNLEKESPRIKKAADIPRIKNMV